VLLDVVSIPLQKGNDMTRQLGENKGNDYSFVTVSDGTRIFFGVRGLDL
jgi:hypothetical protein